MSLSRGDYAFHPVPSTEPSIDIPVGPGWPSPQTHKLESTATGRVWQGAGGRSVRLASIGGDDYHVQFGDSSGIIATSSGSPLFLGGTVESVRPPASATHISVSASSPNCVVATLGYGR